MVYVVHWDTMVGIEHPTLIPQVMGRYRSRRRAEAHARRCMKYQRPRDRIWIEEL